MADQEIPRGRSVRLEWRYPEDLVSHFVSNIVVQHQSDHFVLSFFEVWPPPILGESEEARAEFVESLESIEAKCVARLVVTPEKMAEFTKVILGNLENYRKTRAESRFPDQET